jgi:hypothetical protein
LAPEQRLAVPSYAMSILGQPPRDDLIQLLKYRVDSRPARKSNKKGYLNGHPTIEYAPDLQLLQLAEDWNGYERLLKELIEADTQSTEFIAQYHVLELARFYRKNKRYSDEKQLIAEFQNLLKSKDLNLDDTLASRLRRSTQLAAKASAPT